MTHGHTMLALVHWASRREAATARSTGEAERVRGAECARSTFPVAAALEDFVCFFFSGSGRGLDVPSSGGFEFHPT